jgi:hypothetical protein
MKQPSWQHLRGRVRLSRSYFVNTACLAAALLGILRIVPMQKSIVEPRSAAVRIPDSAYLKTWIADSVLAAGQVTVSANPFLFRQQRVDDNSATVVTHEADAEGHSLPVHQIVVRGILGRPGQWEAVLSGVPELAGDVLVRTGDTLSGMHVRHVDDRTVVLASDDTVFRLEVPRRSGN